MSKGKKKGNLESHKKVGSKLVAPFNEIPNLTSMSWLNDRLPCMIWGGITYKRIRTRCSYRTIQTTLYCTGRSVPCR